MESKDKVKVSIYISSEVKNDLDRLGERRDRGLSNLCEVIFKDEIRRAISSGELSKEESEAEFNIAPLLAKLIDGVELTAEEEEQLAEACDRAPHNVHIAAEKIRKGEGNGKSKAKH